MCVCVCVGLRVFVCVWAGVAAVHQAGAAHAPDARVYGVHRTNSTFILFIIMMVIYVL